MADVGTRTLAPTSPTPMTDARLRRAVARAVDVLDGPCRKVEHLPEIAHALVYLYARLMSDDVLVVGDTMRLSVALLQDLDAMPGHTSVAVTFMGARLEDDGTRLLLLTAVRPKAVSA